MKALVSIRNDQDGRMSLQLNFVTLFNRVGDACPNYIFQKYNQIGEKLPFVWRNMNTKAKVQILLSATCTSLFFIPLILP